MSLQDWIYSVYPPNAVVNGRWGILHISVIAICVIWIAVISRMRGKGRRTRENTVLILACLILFLELARRVINLSRGYTDFATLVYILVPRPWCAISCWLVIAAAFTRKKILYSFSAMNALLNALVFFAWPNVGFHHRVILFEDFYSISTHALLLITSVSMMTLELTDYRYKKADLQKMLILLAGVFAYGAPEILLDIEPDPLFFMPDSDVQDFLGVGYGVFLVIYTVFLAVYCNVFYLVQKGITARRQKVPVS